MATTLNTDQIDRYRRDGILWPLRAISADAARDMREATERFEQAEGYSVGTLHLKGHLCFTWSFDLARSAAILDVVESLIGPNILVFASKFWIKGARDGTFVTWHQDSAYFGLDPHEQVTAWVALTDATVANGCMRAIPGSHHGPAHQHVETYDPKNLLGRGQRIDGLDESTAVHMPLAAGEFSLHHEHIVHSSPPNLTDDVRIGLALFYIPTHVRSTIGRRSAHLVRGIDTHGHWDHDPAPRIDRDPLILAHMREAHQRYLDRTVRQESES